MLCSTCTINSGMCQNSILIHLCFSPTLIVFQMIFCVRFLSEQMIMLLTHHVTNHHVWIQYQKYWKMQFRIHLNIDISDIILYLQTNSYQLKKKNINSPIFISTISNSIQDGKLGQNGRAGVKKFLYQFFRCNFYKRRNYPPKLSDFSF